MPRPPNSETDRATIAKLRARVAQLEASLADIKHNPPQPDMTGWTLDERIKSYAPSRDEEKELQAEFLSYMIQFGWNRSILDKEGLAKYLSEPDNEGVASLLHIHHSLARQLADDMFHLKQKDVLNDTESPYTKLKDAQSDDA